MFNSNNSWTGRKTLGSLDNTIGELRREMAELDRSIQKANEDLIGRRREHAEQIKKLAQLRADLLSDDQVIAGIDQADRQAMQILDQRREEIRLLVEQMDVSQKRQLKLEQTRLELTEQLAEIAGDIDDREAETQTQLQSDGAYKEALMAAHRADEIAIEAESKSQQAEQDRTEKGRPYENDSLFMYLYKRQFGTSEYDSNPLLRYLDAKVARICGYHAARPNYKMLTEIPVRLRQHSDGLRGVASAAFESLKVLEEQALSGNGIVDLRSNETQLESAITQTDADINLAETEFRALMDQRSNYAGGQDEHFKRAIEVLTAEFRRDDVQALRSQAELTRPPEDDEVVLTLIDIEDDIDALDDTLNQHKDIYARHKGRLNELEEVRREFKAKRYDDSHSVFNNSSMMTDILGQFLRGMITSDILWRTMRRNQRFERRRSDPGFGTGGFSLPGVWRSSRRRQSFPGLGKGGGIFGGARSRSRRGGSSGGGSGGFRTGGGI